MMIRAENEYFSSGRYKMRIHCVRVGLLFLYEGRNNIVELQKYPMHHHKKRCSERCEKLPT